MINPQKFKSLYDLQKFFDSDDKCKQYLEEMRWNGKPICPHCLNDKVYSFKNSRTYKCASNKCYKKFTVTVGTYMESSNVPLTKWFMAIYLVTSHKKGISSIQLGKDLGITQKSAWFMLQRIRESLKDKKPTTLKDTVEIDETFVGGTRKNSVGRQVKTKTPVFGIVERGGNVICTPVPDTRLRNLVPLIFKYVPDTNTNIVTDGYKSYMYLSVRYGHNHYVIDHSKFKFGIGKIHTNTIEGFWSLLKRGIVGIYHQVSPKHLHRYCEEFAFRYNTRKFNESTRFNYAIYKINGRLKYKDLVK